MSGEGSAEAEQMHLVRMRRSPRLTGYDYSRPGLYFVTICTHDREPVLGEIVAGEIRQSAAGQATAHAWAALPNRFPAVDLDAFVIMPNHLHGIVVLDEDRAGSQTAPSLATVVRAFKSISGIAGIRALGRSDRAFWQRSDHDRIIRDDRELAAIHRYITDNAARWEHDADNPVRPARS